MMFSFAVLALSSALFASARDINVLVGDGGQLAFNPTSVTALVGDTIHFEFRAKNHSVTQSTFANPCTRSPTGIDSGFFLVAPDAPTHPSWSFTLNDASAPLWFFCGQQTPVNHCQTGMVFAVNAPPDKNFDMYQANAKNSASAGAAPGSSGSAAVSFPGASGAASGVIAPPTSLPTAFSAGGAISGASSSFATAFSSATSGFFSNFGAPTGTGTDGAASAATSSPAANLNSGAVSLRGASSGVAVGAATFVALVAGLLL